MLKWQNKQRWIKCKRNVCSQASDSLIDTADSNSTVKTKHNAYIFIYLEINLIFRQKCIWLERQKPKVSMSAFNPNFDDLLFSTLSDSDGSFYWPELSTYIQ